MSKEPTDAPSEPEDPQSDAELERFQALTRRLLAVPKEAIDRAIEDERVLRQKRQS